MPDTTKKTQWWAGLFTVCASLALAGLLLQMHWGYQESAMFSVTDGDTLAKGDKRFRLAGIDAPNYLNRKGKCVKEDRAAKRARDFVKGWLASHPAIRVIEDGEDIFGRRLVRVEDETGATLQEAMLGAGLAKEWHGKGKKPDWCR